MTLAGRQLRGPLHSSYASLSNGGSALMFWHALKPRTHQSNPPVISEESLHPLESPTRQSSSHLRRQPTTSLMAIQQGHLLVKQCHGH